MGLPEGPETLIPTQVLNNANRLLSDHERVLVASTQAAGNFRGMISQVESAMAAEPGETQASIDRYLALKTALNSGYEGLTKKQSEFQAISAEVEFKISLNKEEGGMADGEFLAFATEKIDELQVHMATLDLGVDREASEWFEYAGVVNKLKLAMEEIETPLERVTKACRTSAPCCARRGCSTPPSASRCWVGCSRGSTSLSRATCRGPSRPSGRRCRSASSRCWTLTPASIAKRATASKVLVALYMPHLVQL